MNFLWKKGKIYPTPAPKSAVFLKKIDNGVKRRSYEDWHSTNSSVSGVEGHSTVWLAHTKIFKRLVLIPYFYNFSF